MSGKQAKAPSPDVESAAVASPSPATATQGSNSNATSLLGYFVDAIGHDMFDETATVAALSEVPDSLVEALREALAGNSLTMVDEAHCLGLLSAMSAAELEQVAQDPGLLNGINAAFNDAELRLAAGMGNAKLAQELFEMRFEIPMKGRYEYTDASRNGQQSSDVDTPDATRDAAGEVLVDWEYQDILDVWDILATLPAQDVEDNTVITAFESISRSRGFWGVSKERGGSGQIMLGQGLNDQSAARINHTVRHEIGHAVHDLLRSQVDSWLDKEVGFRVMGEGRAGCQALVHALGGFPDSVSIDYVLDLLDGQLNHLKWVAAVSMPVPGEDTIWDTVNDDIKTAVTTSSSNWYRQYQQHPSGPEGRVFFNHYYNNTMVFSPVAEAAINATGENYSAMSPQEFFANCYAEYFKDPAGYTDPTKWGGALPGSVKTFFKNHILDRQPYSPPEVSAPINPALTTNNDSGTPR